MWCQWRREREGVCSARVYRRRSRGATEGKKMLRNLLGTQLISLWIGCCRSHLRLLHSPKTLNPSISDLTVSYLINSCGLSPAAALSASKELRLNTTQKADSLLALLSSHGFTKPQIAGIVTKFPVLLSYEPDNIKRKLEFFLGAGLGNTIDFNKVISADPLVLCYSLEKRLVPNFTLLKTIFGTIGEVAAAIGCSSQLLYRNPEKELLPNMKTLQEHGVPSPRIVKLATFYPRVLMLNTVRFSKSLTLLKEMGFEPSSGLFIFGVKAVSSLSFSTWERKLQLYRSLGWSDEDTLVAFNKYPLCMLMSDDKIRKMMGFYVEKLNLEPSYVAARPVLLSFSFEKRVLPRCMILGLLESKGLLKLKSSLSSCLNKSETKFVSGYLTKYGGQVPQLLEAYQGKLDLAVWSVLNPQVVALNGSNL